MVALCRRKPQSWQGPGSSPKDKLESSCLWAQVQAASMLRVPGEQEPIPESGRAQNFRVTPGLALPRMWPEYDGQWLLLSRMS